MKGSGTALFLIFLRILSAFRSISRQSCSHLKEVMAENQSSPLGPPKPAPKPPTKTQEYALLSWIKQQCFLLLTSPFPSREPSMPGPSSDSESPQPTGGRKGQNQTLQQQNEALQQQIASLRQQQNGQMQQPNVTGRREAPMRQSRIMDRPVKEDQKDSSLKIKIELDLEVEVDLYARVKGDVTIGLM